MPWRRKAVAAVEITALAPGPGPPANRIATFLTGWGISQGEAIVECFVGIGSVPIFPMWEIQKLPPGLRGARQATILNWFGRHAQSLRQRAWLTLAKKHAAPSPQLRDVPPAGRPGGQNVRSTNVVSIRPSTNAEWPRISWGRGTGGLIP